MNDKQKEFIDSINKRIGNYTSSYSSSSIFVWENEWKLSIIQGNDFYSVFRDNCFESYYFFPQGNQIEIISFIKNLLSSNDSLVFKYLNNSDVEFLETNFPGVFEIQRDLDSDEYLYSIDEHLTLIGKKFANCRSKLRNFSKEHELTIKKIDVENDSISLNIIYSILDDWALAHDRYHLSSYKHLVENLNYLNADVYLIYMDGKPYSVQSGYNLGNGIYDLCLAQENQNIPGGGYAAKHLLMETIKEKYKYINMEEDLGLSGLRIAKSQTAPCGKNEKWLALKK